MRNSAPSPLLAYSSLMAIAIAAFFLIARQGERLFPRSALPLLASGDLSGTVNRLVSVLLALSAILLCTRAMGALFRKIGQPAVVGEMAGGILLGPSLLGALSPAVQSFLVPPSALPFIGLLAQLAVIVHMFLVGLKLDLGELRKAGRTTLAVSHASIALPFILGSLLALGLFGEFAPVGTGFTSFALFIGTAMSITAFPVLVNILEERGLTQSPLGQLAVTCAAIDDVSAWCLLALVVSFSRATPSLGWITLAATLAYIGGMLSLARPWVERLVRSLEKREKLGEGALAAVFAAVLLSALATESIGIHALFGAFLLGTIIPHESKLARALTENAETLVRALLLPVFFAFTGLRTEIGLLSGASDWLICGGIIAVATAGKFGGTFAAARLTGIPPRDSARLGALMNTRGLVELIVLGIGLDLHIIGPRLYAMLVLMALATTFATSPLLDWIERGQRAPEPRAGL